VPLDRPWFSFKQKKKKKQFITTKKRTVQPGHAFEDTAFKPGFEIVKL
jgi:hypothetical protein